MQINKIFSIGHSSHEIGDFIRHLNKNGIEAVADVRSQPYSKWFPQFNQETLSQALLNAGIQYVFLGHQLGARRSEAECYERDKAKYELVSKTESFMDGIERLRQGAAKLRIALMCSEKEPLDCHRSILICRHLRNDFQLFHIDENGDTESQEQLERRLLKLEKLDEPNLFLSTEELVQLAYDKRSDKIAYVRTDMTHDLDNEVFD